MDNRFEVTASAGTLMSESGTAVRFPHRWTPGGVSVEADFTGGHVLHLAVASCILNDIYREAAALSIGVTGVRVTAAGGFDTATWQSTGIDYSVEVSSDAPADQVAQLVATVGGSALQVGEGVSKNLQTTENMTSAAQGLAAVALTGSIAQDASFCSSNISSNGHLSANRHPHLEVLWSRGLWQGNESPLMLGYLDAMRQQ